VNDGIADAGSGQRASQPPIEGLADVRAFALQPIVDPRQVERSQEGEAVAALRSRCAGVERRVAEQHVGVRGNRKRRRIRYHDAMLRGLGNAACLLVRADLFRALGGFDSLLSTAQMPPGMPVATVAINGAQNAGLLAAQILALSDPELAERLVAFRERQTASIPETVEDL